MKAPIILSEVIKKHLYGRWIKTMEDHIRTALQKNGGCFIYIYTRLKELNISL